MSKQTPVSNSMTRHNIPLGRILGIPIGLDYSWFVIFALLTWMLAGSYYPTEGCQTVDVSISDLSAGLALTVDYLNLVPPPQIDTRARDADDDDQQIGSEGGVVIDDVMLTGLTPGTTYGVSGELLSIDADGSVEAIRQTHTSFVAEADQALVELRFEVPPTGPTTLVATEQISVGDIVVAVHDDLTDADQTLTVTPPPTTTPSTTTPSTTMTPTTMTITPTTVTATPTPDAVATTTTPAVPTAVVVTTSPARTTRTTPPSTLPRTGDDATEHLLRLGDIGFLAGVAMITAAGLLPRRRER